MMACAIMPGATTKEWFTAAELAALTLPSMPTTMAGIQFLAERETWRKPERQWPRDPEGLWRRRKGRGGGFEYHLRCLPVAARARLSVESAIATAALAPAEPIAEAKRGAARADIWTWFDGLPERKKATAKTRLDALIALDTMVASGVSTDYAMSALAPKLGISLRTFYLWREAVAGVERDDWLPHLAPKHAGSAGRSAECDPEAFEWLKAAFLRVERPSFESCYRALGRVAADKAWTVAPARTMRRWIDELPRTVVVLGRQGIDALKRLYPAQERDRSGFHALQAVNADGHRFDVWVKWPDGEISRPVMVAFQDLLSGLILSWRVDRTENREAVRLALGDLVEAYGIPDDCWLDNGRNFASKWISGGSPTRYRFKVRDEEPAGVLTTLGVGVHFTMPYSGQSKPIERAFRDFCDTIAKDIRLAGAWTGNSPVNKPENYGSRAVDIELFLKVLAEGIAEHNQRPGRRGGSCDGRSFFQTFQDSYATAPIRKATAEQRRLWLLAAEGIRARRDGSLELMGNRFWHERLVEHAGDKLIVRFDPQLLHDTAHVYRLDGSFIVSAACIEAVGFADVDAAQAHARARKRWLNAQKDMLAAERTLSVDQAAAMVPDSAEPMPAPETKVVRPLFVGNAALKVDPELDEDREDRASRALGAFVRPFLVPKENGAED